MPVNATWTTDLWRTGLSTTLLISIIVHVACSMYSTTRLQLICQWFPLEVIHTPVHPTSPINLVFIQCSTPLGSQSEISEIESDSLFNRAVRLVIQYTQSEIECYSKPLPFLSFLLFPIWNDEMNGNSDRETSNNKRDYSSTIRMKWGCVAFVIPPLFYIFSHLDTDSTSNESDWSLRVESYDCGTMCSTKRKGN